VHGQGESLCRTNAGMQRKNKKKEKIECLRQKKTIPCLLLNTSEVDEDSLFQRDDNAERQTGNEEESEVYNKKLRSTKK
jgi:hypothetical protein